MLDRGQRGSLADLAATEASKPDDAWTLEFIGLLPASGPRQLARCWGRILIDTAATGSS